jgi:hypothetical protein
MTIEERFPIVVGPSGPKFRSLKDLMEWKPSHYSYEYCDGGRDEGSSASLILDDGNTFQVLGDDTWEHASNHLPGESREGETIGQAIARCVRTVKAVRVGYEYSCSWEDHGQDGDEDAEVIIPLAPIDWGKVRRRLEDRLRKDHEAMVLAVSVLNIPII